MPTCDELVVLCRESDSVDLTLVGNDLLALHRAEIPDGTNTVELSDGEHVGLVWTPVEACDGSVVRADCTTQSLLLYIAEVLSLSLSHHPNFDVFA